MQKAVDRDGIGRPAAPCRQDIALPQGKCRQAIHQVVELTWKVLRQDGAGVLSLLDVEPVPNGFRNQGQCHCSHSSAGQRKLSPQLAVSYRMRLGWSRSVKRVSNCPVILGM